MRRLQILPLAVVATLLVSILPAAVMASSTCEPPAEAADPVPLCGTTLVRGDASGKLRVELPEDSGISGLFSGPDPDISIQGAGAFVGVALRQEVPVGQPAAGFLAGKLQKEPPGPESMPYIFWDLGGVWNLSPADQLPAGTYWLYLLTSGQPVEVRLRFRSLAGDTSLEIAEPASFTARKIVPHVRVENSIFMGADAGEELQQDRGLLFGVAWSMGKSIPPGWGMALPRRSLCVYYGGPSETERMDPACTYAAYGYSTGPTLGQGTLYQSWSISLLWDLPPSGRWGWTANFVNAGLPDDAGAVVGWLTY